MKKILASTPNHFDATHLLGVVALQEGRLERAEELIISALRIKPSDTAALNNLGTTYLRKKQFESAIDRFERAITLQPDSVSALTNLGSALRQNGRSKDALSPLRKAHSLAPHSATVCNLLGACLLDVGDAAQAVPVFEAATLAEPGDADGWGNLAVALSTVGELGRARLSIDNALAIRPASSTILAALAAIEFEEGDVQTAIETYRKSVGSPDTSAKTLCAYANALWTGGLGQEAIDQLRRAVVIDGDDAVARWKLALSQCRSFYMSEADVAASRVALQSGLVDLQAWFRAAPRPEAYKAVGSTQPFYLAYHAVNNRDLLSLYGKLCSEWMTTFKLEATVEDSRTSRQTRTSPPEKKIRVGIASAHIRDHSVWNAIAKGWVQHIDQGRFEVWLFHFGRTFDNETRRAMLGVAHFEEGPKTLSAWLKCIMGAELDVLIYPEIAMDALTTQLASLRLAPVQAASWGHPETTGLPTMDLYLSADALEPSNAQDNYSERLVRLPNLGVYVEPLDPSMVDPDLRALGLPDDEPLLLCPGTPFKYSPGHDHIWVRIAAGLLAGGRQRGLSGLADRLRTRRCGRLVFFRSGNESMERLLIDRLRQAFASGGLDFDKHVVLIPYLDRPRFFGLMQRASLMLDTIGFSGFNNALQAIETGLPVLAREGEFMRGRLASGILRTMELAELVARTDEEFIDSAVRLALDPAKCRQLRNEITARRAPLFRDLEPIRALERCLIETVDRSLPHVDVVRR